MFTFFFKSRLNVNISWLKWKVKRVKKMFFFTKHLFLHRHSFTAASKPCLLYPSHLSHCLGTVVKVHLTSIIEFTRQIKHYSPSWTLQQFYKTYWTLKTHSLDHNFDVHLGFRLPISGLDDQDKLDLFYVLWTMLKRNVFFVCSSPVLEIIKHGNPVS